MRFSRARHHLALSPRRCRFRVLRLFRNNGKGGAVRKGMVRARGRYLLMADADGATKASDLGRLMAELQKVERDGLGIAVGSRAHLEEAEGDAKAKRTPLRKLLMWGFHTLITLMIGNTQIKDTQCGFKLFTRATARLLFPVQHIDRWAFDVELLFLAARNRVPMVVSCSKVDAAGACLGSCLRHAGSGSALASIARSRVALLLCFPCRRCL
jgi:dolichyl-phosphate beta-glucosyltransferase